MKRLFRYGVVALLFPALHVCAAGAFPLTVLSQKAGTVLSQPVQPDHVGYDCQPPLFDPATAKFHLEESGGAPSPLYRVEGQDAPDMMINGWNKEGEDKTVMPAPYDLNSYAFGCASDLSYVLDFQKNGKRLALYTHVSQWKLSNDKRVLALRNVTHGGDGIWKVQLRIVDIPSQIPVNLPLAPCTANIKGWSQGMLVTTSDMSDDGLQATACFWDARGTLQGMISARNLAAIGNSEAPANRIGFLPSEKNTVYVLGTFGDESGNCRIAALNLRQPAKQKIISFDPHVATYNCADTDHEVELDLSTFTLSAPHFRFRIRTHEWKGNERIETVGPWTSVR